MTRRGRSAQEEAADQARDEPARQLHETVTVWSARHEAPGLSVTLGAVCFFTGYTLAHAYASAEHDGTPLMAWEHDERTVAGLVASALEYARVQWHLDHAR